ncbi:hypothetical protein PR048_022802 [Dryococelus australis]|uniref:Uncharacterized protein n=1 Tax=Dryococelus australis TaxID=614101 RepID=A0ABQ9GSC0_9NEOP|nr:hypothetical protein PR048_022802 [Dryococelus australis]
MRNTGDSGSKNIAAVKSMGNRRQQVLNAVYDRVSDTAQGSTFLGGEYCCVVVMLHQFVKKYSSVAMYRPGAVSCLDALDNAASRMDWILVKAAILPTSWDDKWLMYSHAWGLAHLSILHGVGITNVIPIEWQRKVHTRQSRPRASHTPGEESCGGMAQQQPTCSNIGSFGQSVDDQKTRPEVTSMLGAVCHWVAGLLVQSLNHADIFHVRRRPCTTSSPLHGIRRTRRSFGRSNLSQCKDMMDTTRDSGEMEAIQDASTSDMGGMPIGESSDCRRGSITVAERLARKANRVQSPAGSPDFRSCLFRRTTETTQEVDLRMDFARICTAFLRFKDVSWSYGCVEHLPGRILSKLDTFRVHRYYTRPQEENNYILNMITFWIPAVVSTGSGVTTLATWASSRLSEIVRRILHMDEVLLPTNWIKNDMIQTTPSNPSMMIPRDNYRSTSTRVVVLHSLQESVCRTQASGFHTTASMLKNVRGILYFIRKSVGMVDNLFGFQIMVFVMSIITVRLLASHMCEPGSILTRFTPDVAAGQRVFSAISRFLRPLILALLHTHLTSPSSSLKISTLRALAAIFTLLFYCFSDCYANVLEGGKCPWFIPVDTVLENLICRQSSLAKPKFVHIDRLMLYEGPGFGESVRSEQT